MADLQLVQPKVKDRPVVQSSNTCWIPPPAGLMKINVDAALAKNSGIVIAAAVARDSARRFLRASAMVMEGSLEPETVEAISCKEGLALASDFLLQDFRVACDNAGVVASIREGSMGSYGHIVQEIRARSNDFRIVEFIHEGRRSNVDAHNLARSCIYANLGRHVWFVSPPDGVCTSYLVYHLKYTDEFHPQRFPCAPLRVLTKTRVRA